MLNEGGGSTPDGVIYQPSDSRQISPICASLLVKVVEHGRKLDSLLSIFSVCLPSKIMNGAMNDNSASRV